MVDGDLERIQKATQEIKRIRTEDVPRAIQPLKDSAEAYRASVAAESTAIEPRLRQLNDFVAMASSAEHVNDIDWNNPQNSSDIAKIKDSLGNVFFVRTDSRHPFTPELLFSSRARIVPQRNAFNSLPEDDRTRLQEEFGSSKGQAETTKPFADHLRSEALGKRFGEIQQARQGPPSAR